MRDDFLMVLDITDYKNSFDWPFQCYMKQIKQLDYEEAYLFEQEHFKDAPNYHYTPKGKWIAELQNAMDNYPDFH